MKITSITTSTLKHLAVAALLGLCLLVRASDKSAAVAKPAAVVIPKSIFTDDPQSGKDPFFPTSTRRVAVVPRAVLTNAPATSSSFTLLVLKGISDIKGQRLALINSATVAEGELADIRVGLQIVKIRCLAIREASVLLELDGSKEIKEIRLREGI
jgi:hypothetical protein